MCRPSHSREWQGQGLNPGCLTPEPMLFTPRSLRLPTCLPYWTHFCILGTIYIEFVVCGNFLKFSLFHFLPRPQVCAGSVSVFPCACPALCWRVLCSEPLFSPPPLPCLTLRPAHKAHPVQRTTGRTLEGFFTLGGSGATTTRLKEVFDDLVLGV